MPLSKPVITHGLPGQVAVTQRLAKVLDAADREARRMKDEYVSVEHLLVALAEEGSASGAGRVLARHGVTRDAFLAALIGVFAISEMLMLVGSTVMQKRQKEQAMTPGGLRKETRDAIDGVKATLRRMKLGHEGDIYYSQKFVVDADAAAAEGQPS